MTPDNLNKLKGIAPELSEEARLIVFGMSDKEEKEIITDINSIYREYIAGPPAPTIDETLQRLKVSVGTSILGGATGRYFAARRIQDQFNFVTMPAFAVASTAVDGYQRALVDMLRTQTQISFKYGNIFGGILSSMYFVVREGSLFRRIGSYAKRAATIVRATARARETRETAAAVSTGQIELLASVAVDIVASAVLQHVGQDIGQALTNVYARSRAREIFASKLLDKQRIVNDFNVYAGAMAGYDAFTGNNGYQIMDAMRKQTLEGMPLSRLGYDYTRLEPLVAFMSGHARVGNMEQLGQYTAQSALMASMYGISPEQTQGIYAELSLIGPQQKAIADSTREFEKFFLAVAGGSKPQVGQLRLVGELTSFAKNYGYAVKMNPDAPTQLAKIQNFMEKTSVSRMQTTAPTQDLVTGLDAMLNQAVMGESPRALRLMSIAGITAGQAMKGVTGDADMLNGLLRVISHKLDINKSSFDKSGNLNTKTFEQYYMYAQHSLNLDKQTQRALLVALHAYANGARITDVSAAYAKAMDQGVVGLYMDPNFFMTNWTQTFAGGNVQLSNIILKNANILGEINNALITMFDNKVPAIVNMVGQFGLLVTNVFKTSSSAASFTKAASSLAKTLTTPLAKWGPTQERRSHNILGELSKDVSSILGSDFIGKLVKIADHLGVYPMYILAVMEAEDPSFSANRLNFAGSGAVGLIQFMPRTALGLGTTTSALASMTRLQQLDYVEKYLQPYSKEFHSGHNTLADVYAAVFWPAAIGKPLSYVIAKKGSEVYAQNSSLDYGEKGYITKQDLAIRVMLGYNTLFNRKIKSTINIGPTAPTQAATVSPSVWHLRVNTTVNFTNKPALARSVEAELHRNINAQ